MRKENLLIKSLLPIQFKLFKRNQTLESLVRNLDNLPPITTVPYKEFFIVCDGSNRTVAHILAERIYVPSIILEQDSDINSLSPEQLGALSYREKISDLITNYEETYKLICETRGVRSFFDFSEVKGKVKNPNYLGKL